MMDEKEADCLISIGGSSYSDASKIARLLQTNLARDNLMVDAMEALVDQEKGKVDGLRDPMAKLILVPTRIRNSTSQVNIQLRTSLCDPEVASASLRKLWLSSGMRAVDHCVETVRITAE
jgi:alcohol dehydrogenase class IV